jgi:1-aminocyclopropane-1-carboxylate deaminase
LTSLNPKTKLIVVPVLKGFDSIGEMKKLAKKINLTADLSRVLVLDQYHFGGYSKTNNILDQFVIDFNKSSDFKIEQTYTGKALFAMIEYIKNNSLNENKLLFIHTGGIV